ncbi:MAG: autotransporter-associated beta strand repeat-containing protein, partial [Chthoniobacteraceae bacterium]
LYEIQEGSLTGFTNMTIADFTGLPGLPAGFQWQAESTNKYIKLYIGSINGLQQGNGVWTNGSADQNWTTNVGPAAGTMNWGSGQPSSVGHIATFDNTVTNYAGGIVNVNQPQTIGGIVLADSGSGGYNLNGSAIRLENASTSGFATDGISSSRTLTYTDPTITVNSGTHTISNPVVIASGNTGAANGLVVNTAPGSQLHIVGNISAGYALGNSITKQGAGALIVAGPANSYTGKTNVAGGDLNLTGNLTATTNLNLTGGTMLLSGSGGEQINNAATVSMAGGGIGFNNAVNQIETLGNLTLSGVSTLDFGTLGTSGFDSFKFGTGTFTSGSLTILNWEGLVAGGVDGVNDRLVFNGDSTAAAAFQTAFGSSISFNGYGSGFATVQFGSTFEVVAAPIPEPAETAMIGALALCALIGYRERRRFFPRKSAATTENA